MLNFVPAVCVGVYLFRLFLNVYLLTKESHLSSLQYLRGYWQICLWSVSLRCEMYCLFEANVNLSCCRVSITLLNGHDMYTFIVKQTKVKIDFNFLSIRSDEFRLLRSKLKPRANDFKIEIERFPKTIIWGNYHSSFRSWDIQKTINLEARKQGHYIFHQLIEFFLKIARPNKPPPQNMT